MNVRELKAILNTFPENAEVYPYKNPIVDSIVGIAVFCKSPDTRAFIDTDNDIVLHNNFENIKD